MAEHAGPETEPREPADEPTLHLASGEDETEAQRQANLFDAILALETRAEVEAFKTGGAAGGMAGGAGSAGATPITGPSGAYSTTSAWSGSAPREVPTRPQPWCAAGPLRPGRSQ